MVTQFNFLNSKPVKGSAVYGIWVEKCRQWPGKMLAGPCTVEARKLEYDRPLIPKQQKEGKPAEITLNPYSNLLEPAVCLFGAFVASYFHGHKVRCSARDLGS